MRVQTGLTWWIGDIVGLFKLELYFQVQGIRSFEEELRIYCFFVSGLVILAVALIADFRKECGYW